MPYSIVVPHNNGTPGLTLFAALSNADGSPHATVRDIAVTAVGQGFYRANLTGIPDGYSGAGYLYTTALGSATVWTGSVLVADFGLSPQETENADVKTSTVAGLNAAGVRSAVGLAAANLDGQLGAIGTKTNLIPAAPAAVGDIPTANANADALLDRANAVETGITPRGTLRALLASMAGVATGGNTTSIVLKNPAGDTTRVTLAVDANGNRTASTLNL